MVMPRPPNHEYSKLPSEKPGCGDFASDGQMDGSAFSSTNDSLIHHIKRTRAISCAVITVINVLLCLISVATFSVGLRWQIQADRQCLDLHSTFCELHWIALMNKNG